MIIAGTFLFLQHGYQLPLRPQRGNLTGVLLSLTEWERLKKQYGIQKEPPAETGAKLQRGPGEALRKAGLDEAGTTG